MPTYEEVIASEISGLPTIHLAHRTKIPGPIRRILPGIPALNSEP